MVCSVVPQYVWARIVSVNKLRPLLPPAKQKPVLGDKPLQQSQHGSNVAEAFLFISIVLGALPSEYIIAGFGALQNPPCLAKNPIAKQLATP